jgi:hypothetical protein
MKKKWKTHKEMKIEWERKKGRRKIGRKYFFFVHLFKPFVVSSKLINFEKNLFLIIYPKVLEIICQINLYFTFFIW